MKIAPESDAARATELAEISIIAKIDTTIGALNCRFVNAALLIFSVAFLYMRLIYIYLIYLLNGSSA